jgi:two-component sensor histidine kinase
MEAAAQVIIPLQTRGELSGALFLQNSTPRDWSDREMGFAAAVAEKLHASVAKLQAQADQKLLNEELSHRLKNTLAVVQAISAQTLGGRADPDALDAFGARLEALSKAHDVLLQQNWSAARIAALVNEVLSSLNAVERVDVRGVDINLGARAALALAMLLHELTTNAMKHGALSNAAGRVELSWRIEGLGSEATFNLGWRESGGPPAREPSRHGFGSRLIRAGLSGTAATQIAFHPSGFSADFRAPLSFVTEA